jgi:mRNA-degrading endonuclease RelE of RelBE toxin-antitoxin system
MTSKKTTWTVELTRQANRDLKRYRGVSYDRAIRSIGRLERDPTLGEPLTGNLSGARSLHFTLPGSGQHRAAYFLITDNQTVLVFAIGSRENFYRDAERRWPSLRDE